MHGKCVALVINIKAKQFYTKPQLIHKTFHVLLDTQGVKLHILKKYFHIINLTWIVSVVFTNS